jgi:hypothetical protein
LLPKNSGRKYGILVHGNRMIQLKTMQELDLKANLSKIDYSIDNQILEAKVIDIINRITTFLDQNHPDSILGTLFKNSSKCIKMMTEI